MNRILNKLALFLVALTIGSGVQAQAPTTDQLIEQLERSGALDKAVAKSLQRIRDQQQADARLEEQKAEALRAAMARNARAVDPRRDFVLGRPDAPASIIVYSDFECPYCKQFHETPKGVVAEMPDQVNLVWRNFPLGFHDPTATRYASAAVCASLQRGSAGFWTYADGIMRTTKGNGQGMPGKNGGDAVMQLATAQGLQASAFRKCLTSEAVKQRIAADMEDGKASGISGTPGLILVNHRTGAVSVLAGAVPAPELKEAVRALLVN